MCFNMVSYPINRQYVEMPDWLLEAIVRESFSNDDGYAVYAITPEGEVYVRTVKFREFLKALAGIEHYSFLHIHLRAATSGHIDKENVHLWEVSGYLFSHNGLVTRYAGGQDGMSDSRAFVSSPEFASILASKDFGKLAEYVKRAGFTGVAFITKRGGGEAYMISRGKYGKLYTLEDRVIYSNDYLGGIYTPYYVYNVHGVEVFEVAGKGDRVKLIGEGIYDISTPQPVKLADLDSGLYYVHYGNHNRTASSVRNNKTKKKKDKDSNEKNITKENLVWEDEIYGWWWDRE